MYAFLVHNILMRHVNVLTVQSLAQFQWNFSISLQIDFSFIFLLSSTLNTELLMQSA